MGSNANFMNPEAILYNTYSPVYFWEGQCSVSLGG